MKQLTLKTRVYGPYYNRLLSIIKSEIAEYFSELDVAVSKFRTDTRGYVVVTLDGPDEEFASNFLLSTYGATLDFEDLRVGSTITGTLVDVGRVGYGLYIDIGIIAPTRSDLLVPLYKLRKQLNMSGKSLRKITSACLLVDNLPVEVMITKVDSYNFVVEGFLSQSVLDRFEYWVNDDHERLLIFGANYDMVESALRRTNHLEDIFKIETLGRYEHALVCKRSTRASGIVSAIGPRLRGIPIHLFIPREIKAMRDDST